METDARTLTNATLLPGYTGSSSFSISLTTTGSYGKTLSSAAPNNDPLDLGFSDTDYFQSYNYRGDKIDTRFQFALTPGPTGTGPQFNDPPNVNLAGGPSSLMQDPGGNQNNDSFINYDDQTAGIGIPVPAAQQTEEWREHVRDLNYPFFKAAMYANARSEQINLGGAWNEGFNHTSPDVSSEFYARCNATVRISGAVLVLASAIPSAGQSLWMLIPQGASVAWAGDQLVTGSLELTEGRHHHSGGVALLEPVIGEFGATIVYDAALPLAIGGTQFLLRPRAPVIAPNRIATLESKLPTRSMTQAEWKELSQLRRIEANGLQQVSRWGRPGLQPDDWVQLGGPTRLNYILSGKWQPGFGNKFTPFRNRETFFLPSEQIVWPSGWGIDGWWKGLFNQRIYVGAGL
jgi:hypothetical protein